MNFHSLASILIVTSTLLLTGCPDGSKETDDDSATGGVSTSSDETTGTASASTTSDATTTPTTGDSATSDSGTTGGTTDADTTTGATTEPATSSTTFPETTTTETTAETTTTDTTETTTDSGTSEMTSGTTGGGGELEASCSVACDVVIECEPELYPNKEACVQECSTSVNGDPGCETAATAFNNCIAGFTCEDLMAANQGDFGECTDEFEMYIASCE